MPSGLPEPYGTPNIWTQYDPHAAHAAPVACRRVIIDPAYQHGRLPIEAAAPVFPEYYTPLGALGCPGYAEQHA